MGKTVVSAGLFHRYRHLVPLRYWKPIQTGSEQDDDTATVERLANCRERELLRQGVRLPRPVSPHLAARLAGRMIDVPALTEIVGAEPTSDRWVIEGAGGPLVPINDSHLMVDLMVQLALPVLVVARSTLGTINHTLLALEALRSRALVPAGVLMVGPPQAENRLAIEQYGGVAVVGELPALEPLSASTLGAWAEIGLDPSGLLLDLFT